MGKSKIAVVTGVAGFIGSHMADLLLDHGYQVRGIDNLTTGRLENIEHLKNDSNFMLEVRDLRGLSPDDLLFKEAKYVFHFAGLADIVPSIERPLEYFSANMMATVHTLEAARQAGAQKFLYAGSSSCYGLAKELPTSELAEIDPQYPYALSKYLGEQAVMHWGKVYRLPTMSLRIFNAYGPRSRTSGTYGSVFGIFLAQKLAGKPFTVVGDGSQKRDFVFVKDVAAAFWLAAQCDRTDEIYNLGTGDPQSINRLVELLEGKVVYVPKRPGEPDCTWADTRKIRHRLAWEPKISFEEGVAIMFDNIEYWRDAPVWVPSSIEETTKDWFAALS